MKALRFRCSGALLVLVASLFVFGGVAEAAWPTRPVEFVIPAGVGGGADQYARFLIGLNVKSHFIPKPIIPVNLDGGAGAVAMASVLKQKGNGHQMMITLNAFITTPLFQKLPFNYRNFTPIALLALDNFPLWVHKDSPYKNWNDFLTAARERSIPVCRTGSKQEDEIVFRAIEKIGHTKPFKYIPFKGGGDVAQNLVGKHCEATVNQVSEAGMFYPDYVRPLVVFQDKRLDIPGYENVPTGKELGFDFSYEMMRAIFAPPGITEEARSGLIELARKMSQDPEWLKFAKKAGLRTDFISGDQLTKFCENYEKKHIEIMKAQGWIQ